MSGRPPEQPPPVYPIQVRGIQPQQQAYSQSPYGQAAPRPYIQPSLQPPPPAVVVASPAPGAVAYQPQVIGAAPQVILGAPVLYYQSPRFEYKPNDFLITTILTIIVCGCFSPLSLMFSLPALYYAIQSSKSAKANSIKLARSQGMIAAYLNAAAVIFALVVAFVVSAAVIDAYAESYIMDKCIRRAEEEYGGGGGYYYSHQCY